MIFYAKEIQGRVVQDSVMDDSVVHTSAFEVAGYVPVLAVRAAGVAEIRRFLADADMNDGYPQGAEWALRVLGLGAE